MKPRNKRRIMRDIAIQRIRLLYKFALRESIRGDYDRVRRYVQIAMKISAKGRVRIPRSIKRRICKNCKIILVPGSTSVVRLRNDGKRSWIVERCLICGWIRRTTFKGGERCGSQH